MGYGEAGRRTRVLRVDPERPDPSAIREAARALQAGGLVVFPTETVYGLGADATNGRAVAGVFAAKGRPSDNPLIVHVASLEDVPPLVRRIDPRAEALVRAFWPGPLSLIFPRSDLIAPEVSCGLDTVAIRMPRHPVALELVRLAGLPVAAPSANTSGRPSPTRAEDVLADLDGRVDYVLDGGPCPIGVESTVLDLSGEVPTILRPGGVTAEELRRVIGEVRLLGRPSPAGGPEGEGPRDDAPAARSPGLRHRHYSPRARLLFVLPDGPRDGQKATGARSAAGVVARAIVRTVATEAAAGRKVGVACTRETARALQAAFPPPGGRSPLVITWGGRERPEEVAAGLFAALRDLDRAGVEVIVAEGLPPEGLGLAVNDRLSRAAAEVFHVPAPAGVAAPGERPASPGAPATSRAANAADNTAAGGPPELVLLVCSGNTCRSPMASVILKDILHRRGLGELFQVESAGVAAVPGEPASPEARQVAAERGLDLSGHVARPLDPDLLARARLILTMTRRHRQDLVDRFPWAADRVYTLKGYAALARGETAVPGESDEDIADPIGRGLEAYRQAAAEIERAAAAVAEGLRYPVDIIALVEPGDTPENQGDDEEEPDHS